MANGERWCALGAALLVCLACTTTSWRPTLERVPRPPEPVPELEPAPLDLSQVRAQPEGRTVEQNWILDLYTLFHARDYRAFRILYPGSQGGEETAHLLIPPGPGPHPLVVVFPILAGSHVVSEGLAKALVRRRFAVARMERHDLELDQAPGPEAPARHFRGAILDARRLLDWLLHHPQLDPKRVAAAGVSMGGILALTLMQVDPRVHAGFFLMVGGGLPEILYDSSERPVRIFRERLQTQHTLETREAFLEYLRPFVEIVDPLTYAARTDPRTVLIASGRLDRVVRPRHTRALWQALGEPRWVHLPLGHYQFFPFFWWAIARGADHLERVFAEPSG